MNASAVHPGLIGFWLGMTFAVAVAIFLLPQSEQVETAIRNVPVGYAVVTAVIAGLLIGTRKANAQ